MGNPNAIKLISVHSELPEQLNCRYLYFSNSLENIYRVLIKFLTLLSLEDARVFTFSRFRNGEKSTPTELNGTIETFPISKLRQALPQFCAVSAKNLLMITFGSTLGFSTILIPQLQKPSSEISVSMEDLTWISSLNLFLVPIGCFVSGPISQMLGRKRTMMLTTIPFIAAWIIFHYATSTGMLFIALAMTGLTGGLLEAPVMTYVAEVTQPHLRGMLSATSSMSIILGIFTQMLGGKLAHWRTVSLVNLTYPLICFVVLCMVPESPYWLIAQGRQGEAEKALCWLRGWVRPAEVKSEFETICQEVYKPAESREAIWKAFGRRTFYTPFLLVTCAFFIGAFGGTITLQTFAVMIFMSLKAPIEEYSAAVYLGLAELLGTLICVIAIHFTGKRLLNFVSIGGTGLSFGLTAIYGYLNDSNILDADLINKHQLTWLPATLMIGAAFLSHTGIRLLPWVLAGEVFPVKLRSSATGMAGSIGYVFTSIANKVFLYMVNGMSLAGTFFFYALINFVGGVLLYFILPETEGRTLNEIEEHFAGIQNLKTRPKKEEQQNKEKWAATNPAVIYDDTESKL
ncbi:facilitated trehalose transporter Tret1-like [Ceratina calcarata]|uniref:Facilitated trehalose transporter Tret1-like n=1 Tax=Ceratina calcarata TaxID=156304 RepID=A0AAJ7RXH4_9HYME|nr:facilitated trehalose transporter Tret1-like [Ceratina calcarata]